MSELVSDTPRSPDSWLTMWRYCSAVMNLLQNAFKYTPAKGNVALRTQADNGRVLIEVEDECGGLDQGDMDLSHSFGDRRRRNRPGLGLGLSVARKAATAIGGGVHTRNLPGKGCVFSIELPLASGEAQMAPHWRPPQPLSGVMRP